MEDAPVCRARAEHLRGDHPDDNLHPESVTDGEDKASDTELERLECAVSEGKALSRDLDRVVTDTRRRLGDLRAEASQLRRSLERELVDVRVRILELAESETEELVGSTERALADAREEVAALLDQLAAAESDRHELVEHLQRDRARAAEAEQSAGSLRRKARAHERTIQQLEAEIDALGASDTERFVALLERAWTRMTTPSDRERFPWRVPVFGPDFLDSLRTVEGVALSKVIDVCAHAVSGRAAEISGLELHMLRESEAGGAAQQVRADGARAWRCNLQAGTAAARRLHYWQLPDGGIELAKIVYHDDFSIR